MEIIYFKDCSYKNKHLVGGKCSSLGELYSLSQKLNFGIADGFAVTTHLYDSFIEQNNLSDTISSSLLSIDYNNIQHIEETSKTLINAINNGTFNESQITAITNAYNKLCEKYNMENCDVAIRSSAIAEDLPNASFAGQQDTFLNCLLYTSDAADE